MPMWYSKSFYVAHVIHVVVLYEKHYVFGYTTEKFAASTAAPVLALGHINVFKFQNKYFAIKLNSAFLLYHCRYPVTIMFS